MSTRGQQDGGDTDTTLENGGSLTSTDHHPFWSEDQRTWLDAADLKTGQALRDPAGRPQRIEDIRHWNTLQPAYNLTVEDLHTYYAVAGDTPVLAHNADVYCPARLALGATEDWNTGTFDILSQRHLEVGWWEGLA
ncbi:polymorphic toxin-type HINT domain-containing protein [Kitasatospora sp. NPDC087314]|uniref:polymorphic toxin-type HINT domain-containing protein n=1 Tax=Kitasatospora sp. NPDC087314 TaxID=3364068 RepID=UPI00380ADCE9